jgi:hypothetical protein
MQSQWQRSVITERKDGQDKYGGGECSKLGRAFEGLRQAVGDVEVAILMRQAGVFFVGMNASVREVNLCRRLLAVQAQMQVHATGPHE